jgi:hypothetical protein
MELTIKGVIRRVTEPREFGSGKRMCEVHIELAEQKFEQIIPLTFWNDDVDEAIGLTVGATIEAKCWLRGNESIKTGMPARAFASFAVFDYKLPDPKSIRETVIEDSKKNPPQVDDMPWDVQG